jgi:hypothetical protein
MVVASSRFRSTALALLVSCAASCGDAPATRGSATVAPDAPLAGTILYHEPAPQQGVASRRTTPVTQIFTTDEGDLAEKSPVQAFSGTVEGVEHGQPISDKQMKAAIQRMLQRTNAGSTRILPPDRFQVLWERVVKAGLFKLPLYRGEGKPESDPYFLVKSGDRTWIFERPAVTQPRPDDPAIPLIKTWNDVKLVFFDFLNER